MRKATAKTKTKTKTKKKSTAKYLMRLDTAMQAITGTLAILESLDEIELRLSVLERWARSNDESVTLVPTTRKWKEGLWS